MRNQTTGQNPPLPRHGRGSGELDRHAVRHERPTCRVLGKGPLRPEPAAGHDLHPRPDHLDHRPANDSSEPITGGTGRHLSTRPLRSLGLLRRQGRRRSEPGALRILGSAVASRPRRPARCFSIHAKVARFPRALARVVPCPWRRERRYVSKRRGRLLACPRRGGNRRACYTRPTEPRCLRGARPRSRADVGLGLRVLFQRGETFGLGELCLTLAQ